MFNAAFKVKLVCVTKRVHEAYVAELYLSKLDNNTKSISLDLRPSNAINITVRCKVPIKVNKYLAFSDGMRIVVSEKSAICSDASDGLLLTELDRPTSGLCIETKEFILVWNMLVVTVEERYADAAEALSVKNTALWMTDGKTFETWIYTLVCALIEYCDDMIRRLSYIEGYTPTSINKQLSAASDGLLLTELDRPTSGLCIETKEFILVRNMLVVIVEERYADAGDTFY